MKVLKKRVLFACAVIAMPLMAIQFAHACDCIGPRTAAMQLEGAAIAGIFKLRSIEIETRPDIPRTLYRPKFTVEKIFKGALKVGDEFILSPPRTNCDWFFSDKDVGVRFLLYISPNAADSTDLRVHLCSRSGPVSRSRKELKELEKITLAGRKKRHSGNP